MLKTEVAGKALLMPYDPLDLRRTDDDDSITAVSRYTLFSCLYRLFSIGFCNHYIIVLEMTYIGVCLECMSYLFQVPLCCCCCANLELKAGCSLQTMG